MPTDKPSAAEETATYLGDAIRTRRKALGVSATATAEAANISRVTLHRIEGGESSVNMAAYLKVLTALGLNLQIIERLPKHQPHQQKSPSIPVRISLTAYPILKSLAWQVHGTDSLTPQEAWDIYDRNRRHADMDNASADELALIDALQQVFAQGGA